MLIYSYVNCAPDHTRALSERPISIFEIASNEIKQEDLTMSTISQTRKKWSQAVTEKSNALRLEKNIFTGSDPKKIAYSLKQSALKSKHRKGTPFQSAMSMLNFYINRAGRKLDKKHKDTLQQAKIELQILFKKI